MSDEPIDRHSASVQEELGKFLKKHWAWSLGILSVTVLLGITFVLIKLYVLIALALLPAMIYLATAYFYARRNFFSNFAKSLGLTYTDAPPRSMVGYSFLIGSYFQRGHAQTVSNYMSGRLGEYPVEMFNYQYTTGSGKHRKRHGATVLSMHFNYNTPELILNSKSESFFLDTIFLAEYGLNRIPTEGIFEEHFSTYARDQYEIEVLELLTTEVMEQIIARGPGYDYQFATDRVFIFEDGLLGTRKSLLAMVEVGKYLAETLSPRLVRMQDDLRAMRDAGESNSN